VASLTSLACSLFSAREAGIAAIQQVQRALDLTLKWEHLFTAASIDLGTPGAPGIGIAAGRLEAADLASIVTDYMNRGLPAFTSRLDSLERARLGGRSFLTVFPDFLDVQYGPVNILEQQLFSRAFSQDSKRYWVMGRRRVRTTSESS
jgi:hypothetical protein